VVRSRTQLAWALAACAAIVAQVSPKTSCHACDRPCCADWASDHGPSTADLSRESAGGCPLCATKADVCQVQTTERPCHCQLKPRHEEPLAVSKDSLPAFADDGSAVELAVFPAVVPRNLGVSREYVVTSLAVPIRPARILFGVWRN
jgi:hypothetical protein